jgi:hypothetical protein
VLVSLDTHGSNRLMAVRRFTFRPAGRAATPHQFQRARRGEQDLDAQSLLRGLPPIPIGDWPIDPARRPS